MKHTPLKALFFANLLTTLGTAMVFIPVGNLLAPSLGVGGAYSFLLVLAKAPLVFAAGIYVRAARRFGTAGTIAVTQFIAMFFSLISVGATVMGSTPLLITGLVGTAFSAAALSSLFPGFLHQRSRPSEHFEALFARWYFIQHLALVVSTLLGAYLETKFSIVGVLAIDAATFAAAAATWIYFASIYSKDVSKEAPKEQTTFFFSKLTPQALRFQVANLSRNIFYGFANALMPVLILQHLAGSSMDLGYLYLSLGGAALIGAQCATRVSVTSRRFFGLNMFEISLLCVGLLSTQMWMVFVVLFVAVLMMAINEVKLQTFFFAAQPEGSSVSSSAGYEQAINIGSLSGYALYNMVSHGATSSVLIVLAVSLCGILLAVFRK